RPAGRAGAPRRAVASRRLARVRRRGGRRTRGDVARGRPRAQGRSGRPGGRGRAVPEGRRRRRRRRSAGADPRAGRRRRRGGGGEAAGDAHLVGRTRGGPAAHLRLAGGSGYDLTYGLPSAAGGRARPTTPATTRIVTTYGVISRNWDGMGTFRI